MTGEVAADRPTCRTRTLLHLPHRRGSTGASGAVASLGMKAVCPHASQRTIVAAGDGVVPITIVRGFPHFEQTGAAATPFTLPSDMPLRTARRSPCPMRVHAVVLQFGAHEVETCHVTDCVRLHP